MKPIPGLRVVAATVAATIAFAMAAPSTALAVSAAPITPIATTSTGTTYYVSDTEGDDNNNGTSEAKPWKTLNKVNEIASELEPGDSVLLKRGDTFNNQYLHIKDTSGSKKAPITIASYGDEAQGKPVIAANGVEGSQWYQDYKAKIGGNPHKYQGTVSTTVLLKDVSYITVKDLEITNDDAAVHDPIDTWSWTDSADTDGTSLDRSSSRMDRTGVAGIAENGTTMSNVILDNLYIHDVDGNIYNKHMANGGIYFMAHLPEEHTAQNDAYLRSHVSRFDRITVKNSTIKDVDRWGIAVGYTAYLNYIDNSTRWNNDFNYGDGQISDSILEQFGATNVLIENNYLKGIGGDAITTMYCLRPIIQYNVGDSVSKHINTVDYLRGDGRVAAGIWPWRCKDPIFQYNEMYNNLNAEHGNGDGQAWDADYGDGTLYQYNYSYGNSFAALMICGYKAINTTFRYNISQNDRRGVFDLPSNGPGNHIYNNTLYIGADSQILTPNRSNSQAQFENNIFINATDSKKQETWNMGTLNGGQKYDNNMYVNYSNKPASDAHAIEVDNVADVLVNAGSAPTGPTTTGAVYGNASSAFEGYKLVESDTNKAINAGKVIDDMNDYDVEHDFMGNKIVGIPDLGAMESSVKAAAQVSGTVNDYATKEINGTKHVYVAFTAKNPTTVSELLSGVTAGEGSEAAVWRGSEKLADTKNLEAGDILRFSGESGDTIDYTVTQKNTWNWVADYEHGTADFDWKAQRQTATGSAWQTITAYDSGYPQTMYNQWYGVGLDYDAFNTNGHKLPDADKRDAIHGLIAEDPAATGGTAMAWKASKSGTVTVSIKSDEPYIRQTGNNGKAITLKLMHNDTEICSADLTESKKKSDAFATCVADHGTIVVQKGDWIRITAEAVTGMSKPSVHVSPIITLIDVEPPASKQADEYEATYAATDATVGTEAASAVTFTKDGNTIDAPDGVTYSIDGDANGFAVGKAGKVTFTPTDAQFGQSVSKTIIVTYKDQSTDKVTVTFNVAQSHVQRLNVRYNAITMNAGTTVSALPRFFEKADSARTDMPAGTTFALGAGADSGATIIESTGELTYTAGVTAGSVTIPVTVTYPNANGTENITVTITVKQPATIGNSMLEFDATAKEIYVPLLSENPTTVAQLLSLATADPADAVKSVWRNGKELLPAESIQAGDILRFSAAGSTVVDDYTVVEKNTWNWVNDYEQNVNGPIWESQYQTAADSGWSTINAWDSSWPNTLYNTYYGAGVNNTLADLNGDRAQTHGLLIDDPSAAGATAMAWKAPKSGSVTFTFKTGFSDGHAEPYLRQNLANNGKKVTLKLLKNSETLCESNAMTQYQVTDTAFNECLTKLGSIEVKAGDWIRLAASAESGMRAPSFYASPIIEYQNVKRTEGSTKAEQHIPTYTEEGDTIVTAPSVDGKVGDTAEADLRFVDEDGNTVTVPNGTMFQFAAKPEIVANSTITDDTDYGTFELDTDGTMRFTANENAYGQKISRTVTVAFPDGSNADVTVIFNIAKEEVTPPTPNPDPTPKPDPSPSEPDDSGSSGSVVVWRLYNPNSGLHHYTTNKAEYDYLGSIGWNQEKESFKAAKAPNANSKDSKPNESNKNIVPVYRLYNPNDGNHHWTMSVTERDWLVKLGWNAEGIGWYVDTSASVTVWRLYNPNSGEHLYTTNKGEYNYLGSIGWNQEEVAWKSL